MRPYRFASRCGHALFDSGFANQFFCRGGTEVVCHFSFQSWLIALEGKQVVGPEAQ